MSASRLKLNSEKTELVWVGSRYGHTPLGSLLQLGTDTVAASDHVRVLGVTISSDLSESGQARLQRVCEVFFSGFGN